MKVLRFISAALACFMLWACSSDSSTAPKAVATKTAVLEMTVPQGGSNDYLANGGMVVLGGSTPIDTTHSSIWLYGLPSFGEGSYYGLKLAAGDKFHLMVTSDWGLGVLGDGVHQPEFGIYSDFGPLDAAAHRGVSVSEGQTLFEVNSIDSSYNLELEKLIRITNTSATSSIHTTAALPLYTGYRYLYSAQGFDLGCNGDIGTDTLIFSGTTLKTESFDPNVLSSGHTTPLIVSNVTLPTVKVVCTVYTDEAAADAAYASKMVRLASAYANPFKHRAFAPDLRTTAALLTRK